MTFGAQQQPGRSAAGPGGRPPGRGRARRLLPLGVALWAVLEIWLLTVVAEAAGGLTVLALLIAGAVLGSIVVKRAGRRAWRRLSDSLQPGSPSAAPAPESGGTGLTMLGGLLLILPGFLSDAAGLLCLFPPTRALLRRTVGSRLAAPTAFAPGSFGDAFQQARIHHPDGKVVQGEVVRDEGREPSGPRHDGPQLPR
ncbi:FxsA family membrane protein [Streptomyces gamaensis]|uniref:FxsA family membrane protein n=1 Tax=Streptomyces gamaensis TaxID=1763542 RepID=A0ABW0ZBG0_9ACTN